MLNGAAQPSGVVPQEAGQGAAAAVAATAATAAPACLPLAPPASDTGWGCLCFGCRLLNPP